MTNTETSTDKAAAVAAQGAHVAPKKASSKKGASKKTARPTANGRQGWQSQGYRPEEGRQARQREGGPQAARREQRRRDSGPAAPGQGRHAGSDHGSYRLAGAQRPGLHFDRR